MNRWRRRLADWRQDPLLGRVVRNSGYLFSSSTLVAGLAFVQGILSTRMVGVAGLGLVTTVITVASNINILLSFRMSEVVVKRLKDAQAGGDREQAAVAVKAAGLIETGTSLLAFLVLLLLAPWAARVLAKDPQSLPWFLLYGLVLLGNLIYETGRGVLQATGRFDRLARIALVQGVMTFAVIGATFMVDTLLQPLSLTTLVTIILSAYLAGKFYGGFSVVAVAWREMNGLAGTGWWRVPLGRLADRRGMLVFIVNTNLNGTVNLVTRDSMPLFVAGFLTTTAVGYLKLAQSLVSLIPLTLDPFIWPTYTEITQTIARREWSATRRLLRRVSLVASAWALAVGGGLALTGWWLLPTLYGAEASPAYPALLLLLAGYCFGGVFQWNRPLLLALGKPGYPVVISALVGLLEVLLIVWLVPRYGYLAAAAILSGYFLLAIGLTAGRGLLEIRARQRLDRQG